MKNKQRTYYPIVETLGSRVPDFTDLLRNDRRVLATVDRMLSAPEHQLDALTTLTRIYVTLRDNRTCDDARLAHEIDNASLFICNQELFIERELGSRYNLSEL